MTYHDKRNAFDKDFYDPMQLGATVEGIITNKGIPPEYWRRGVEEWEDLLEIAKDAPAKIKEAYNNYYAQKNKKKSSTRDKVVAKVKKSRSK